jgi:hypothetical protein
MGCGQSSDQQVHATTTVKQSNNTADSALEKVSIGFFLQLFAIDFLVLNPCLIRPIMKRKRKSKVLRWTRATVKA